MNTRIELPASPIAPFISVVKMTVFAIAITLLLSGCGGGGNEGGTTPPGDSTHKTTLNTENDYRELQGARNELKFILPISDRSPPAPLTAACYFQNTQTYPLHLQFLRSLDGLENLSGTQYESMVLPPSRSLWAGELIENTTVSHPQTGEQGIYLYVLTTDDESVSLQPDAADIVSVDQTLKACVPWAASKIVYTTVSNIQEQNLESISSQLTAANVAWLKGSQSGDDSSEPTVYSAGEYYGYLKWFEAGETPDDVGPLDIVISQQANNSLGLLAGLVTDLPQTYLSHLNVRLREKGIPSARVPDVLNNTEWRALEDQLVHLVVSESRVTINTATQDEAEEFWANNHPDVGQLRFDLSHQTMLSFAELRADKAVAYGSKAANLGELYQALGADAAVNGFGIPTYWYYHFMLESGLDAEVTRLLNDERVFTDAKYRKDQLKALRSAIRSQSLPDDFMQQLWAALTATFGADVATTRIRFRSSTNAEDLVEFSGAGLYDSKSGCLADLDDGDEDGPSRCLHAAEKADLEQQLATRRQELADYPERVWLEELIEDIEKDLSEEKPLDEAVLKVWASLWTLRAFDEREYYRLDHRKAYMGMAVNKSFIMERREAVAITNERTTDQSDSRQLYRINTQLGNIGVVRPDDPSAVAEEMTFRRGTSQPNQAESILVPTRSSLSPDTDLWNDSQKQLLATNLFKAQDHFATEVYGNLSAPAFEVEIEVLGDSAGQDKIFLKQLRPYLPQPGDDGGDPVACSDSSTYVGDDDWPVTMTIGENVDLCYYPRWLEDDFADIIAKKDRITIASGNYKLPDSATDSMLSIPMCLSDETSPTGSGAPKVITDNLIDLTGQTSVHSFYETSSAGLLLRIAFPENATRVQFNQVATTYPGGLAADFPAGNLNDSSRLGNYRQCQFESNGSYQVTVDGIGALLIEHFTWAGTVGAGFVAPTRVSGTWRGQTIDINRYEQMTVSYQQHAFGASLHLMFDQPINGEYGVNISSYYDEFGRSTEAWTLDESGNNVNRLSGVNSVRQN